MRPHACEIPEEVRETYSYEPVCKFLVEIFLDFENRWDHDAYFLTHEQAFEHADLLREAHLMVRIRRCEAMG